MIGDVSGIFGVGRLEDVGGGHGEEIDVVADARWPSPFILDGDATKQPRRVLGPPIQEPSPLWSRHLAEWSIDQTKRPTRRPLKRISAEGVHCNLPFRISTGER